MSGGNHIRHQLPAMPAPQWKQRRQLHIVAGADPFDPVAVTLHIDVAEYCGIGTQLVTGAVS